MTIKRQLLTINQRSVDVRIGAGALDGLSSLVGGVVGKPKRALVVVRDDRERIASEIVRAVDELAADVVITCGGTGLSPRDVTPEATRDACERDVPGIAEAMRAYSMSKTRRAMLSRAVCMQRGRALVVNFPGSTKAARENWEAIADQLEHAVRMAAGEGH